MKNIMVLIIVTLFSVSAFAAPPVGTPKQGRDIGYLKYSSAIRPKKSELGNAAYKNTGNIVNTVATGDQWGRVYNVKNDCGLKGDRTTDDTIAMKNCIANAVENSVLFMPTGGYRFTDEFLIDKKLWFKGEGFKPFDRWKWSYYRTTFNNLSTSGTVVYSNYTSSSKALFKVTDSGAKITSMAFFTDQNDPLATDFSATNTPWAITLTKNVAWSWTGQSPVIEGVTILNHKNGIKINGASKPTLRNIDITPLGIGVQAKYVYDTIYMDQVRFQYTWGGSQYLKDYAHRNAIGWQYGRVDSAICDKCFSYGVGTSINYIFTDATTDPEYPFTSPTTGNSGSPWGIKYVNSMFDNGNRIVDVGANVGTATNTGTPWSDIEFTNSELYPMDTTSGAPRNGIINTAASVSNFRATFNGGSIGNPNPAITNPYEHFYLLGSSTQINVNGSQIYTWNSSNTGAPMAYAVADNTINLNSEPFQHVNLSGQTLISGGGALNGTVSKAYSGIIPYTQLGTGGTGSGTKVLTDAGTFIEGQAASNTIGAGDSNVTVTDTGAGSIVTKVDNVQAMKSISYAGGGVYPQVTVGNCSTNAAQGFPLTVCSDAGSATMGFASPAGQVSDLFFSSGTNKRWNFRKNSTAESGSDAGSDFEFFGYTDALTAFPVWSVTRGTKVMTTSVDNTYSLGKTIKLTEGTGGCAGTGTVNSTTGVTISTSCVKTNSKPIVTWRTCNNNACGSIWADQSDIVDGVSFKVKTGTADTASTFYWVIIN